MARLTRRGFVQASGALAAAPALAAIAAQAQGPAPPDTGNLRVEKDIVFGKGGQQGPHARCLPAGRQRDVETHGHRAPFRRRLLRRQQERRVHHQRHQTARRQGLHEHLGELPAPAGKPLASADSRHQGGDPLDARQRRSPGHRRESDCDRRLFGRRDVGAHGRRHERAQGVRGRRAATPVSARTSTPASASTRWRARRLRQDSSRRGRQRPRTSRPRHLRRTSPRASRRRSSFTVPRTAPCRCSRASTSGPSSRPSACRPR